jgi:tRNA(Ile)-lysidine synthase
MSEEQKTDTIEQSVADVIERQGLFREGDRVLVAVSGGADSTALLTILHRLSGPFGIELAVGHFDHRLRDTSHMDRRHVEVAAANLDLPFHHGEGDVMTRADAHGETVEEAARKLRYQYLFEVAEKIRADRIATGHTRDDQVETVLMRILRGTGTRGLSGIPAARGRLVRPLLALTHLELVNYCRRFHIPFVEDPLNRDKRFTRNWLRFELLPSIRKYYPSVGENLLRLSRNAADAVSRTRRTTAPLIARNLRYEHDPGVWTLDLKGIADLDPDAKYILFGDLLTDHLDHDPDYTRVHFEKLGRLSGRGTESGESLSIPGFTVRREFDTLVFSPSRKEARSPSAAFDTLPVPGRAAVGGVRIEAAVSGNEREIVESGDFRSKEPRLFESGGNPGGGVAYFALEGLEPPLIVRSPRAGDRMRPFGMRGSKKLSDIFIDKKIPLRRRDRALVVCDQKQILWLVGVGTAETARITAETGDVLKITVNPE